MKRKITALVLAGIMAFSCSVFAANNLRVVVDGKEAVSERAIIKDGRILMPYEDLGSAMGMTAIYDEASKYIVIGSSDCAVSIPVSGTTAKYFVNNVRNTMELDVPVQTVNGEMLVPVRAVAEMLDAELSWNGDSKTLTIKTSDNIAKAPSENSASTVANNNYGISNEQYSAITAEYREIINDIAATKSAHELNVYIEGIENSKIGQFAIKWTDNAENDNAERYVGILSYGLSYMITNRESYFILTATESDKETVDMGIKLYGIITQGLNQLPDKSSLDEAEALAKDIIEQTENFYNIVRYY